MKDLTTSAALDTNDFGWLNMFRNVIPSMKGTDINKLSFRDIMRKLRNAREGYYNLIK